MDRDKDWLCDIGPTRHDTRKRLGDCLQRDQQPFWLAGPSMEWKRRAEGSRFVEFGNGPSSNAVIKTGGETVSLLGFDWYVGAVTIMYAQSVCSPQPMTADLASADPISL